MLTVHPDGLDLQPDAGLEAHAVVRGTLPEIAASVFGTQTSSSGHGGIRIDGDEATLQSVVALFRDLEPDLAEPLSSLLGRDAADDLLGAAEAGLAFLKSAAESVRAGLRQEAQDVWMTEDGFRNLMDRTEDLKLRVDRLAARVELAEAREQR
jgi:ubiquinone biosynthesis protein UbiJ